LIALSRYDLTIWEVLAQRWRKDVGQISFSIGANSRGFKLQGDIFDCARALCNKYVDVDM
jgi:beta-glucosidase